MDSELRARVLGVLPPNNSAPTHDFDAVSPHVTANIQDSLHATVSPRGPLLKKSDTTTSSIPQIDLNEEVAVVEDAVLISHMKASRARVMAYQKTMSHFAQIETLRAKYIKSMGIISTVIKKLDEICEKGRHCVEQAFYHEKAQMYILEGKKPVGYGDATLDLAGRYNPTVQKAILEVAKKSGEIARMYENTLETVKQEKQKIFTVRREFETTGEGLIKISEDLEEDRKRTREYLALVSEVGKNRATATPSANGIGSHE